MIPGLNTLKTWALGGLAILSAVLVGWVGLLKSKHANAKLKGIEKARKVEHEAHEEIQKGAKRTQEKVDEATKKVDNGDYSHFES